MGSISGPAGSYAVSEDFTAAIVEGKKFISGLPDLVTDVPTPTGATLPIPLLEDTSALKANIVSENTSVSDAAAGSAHAACG